MFEREMHRRNHTIIYAICSVVIVYFLMIAVPFTSEGDGDEISIVGTNSILADFIENVIGDQLADDVTITYIMPAGACPAHFDTSPSDILSIESAEIIVSLGWEPWLTDLIESSGNEEVLEIKCMGCGEWLIPSGVSNYVEKIIEGLTEYNPDWEDILIENGNGFVTEAEEEYENAREQIIDMGLNGTKVVAIEWYTEFLNGLGFEVVLSYGPPESLSTADIINITETLGDPEIAMIIDNLQSGVDFGSNIAAEMGKSHVVLSNFPGAIPDKDTYIENMNYNIDELINGAISYESHQEDVDELEAEISSLRFQRILLISILGIVAAISVILTVIRLRR